MAEVYCRVPYFRSLDYGALCLCFVQCLFLFIVFRLKACWIHCYCCLPMSNNLTSIQIYRVVSGAGHGDWTIWNFPLWDTHQYFTERHTFRWRTEHVWCEHHVRVGILQEAVMQWPSSAAFTAGSGWRDKKDSSSSPLFRSVSLPLSSIVIFYQNIVQNSINVFNFNSDLLYHDAIQYILCSPDEQPPGHTAGFSTVQAVTFQGPANIHEMFLPQMPERSLGLAETEFPPFHWRMKVHLLGEGRGVVVLKSTHATSWLARQNMLHF